MTMRRKMIKNLTQIFTAGFVTGSLLTGLCIAVIYNVWGLGILWILFTAIVLALSGGFYEKLKRCQKWEE